MIFICWLFTLGTFIVTTTILGMKYLSRPETQRHIRNASAFIKTYITKNKDKPRPPKYPVELWVWESLDDEYVCEDCWDRSCWPPMDIADWMREGLPGTPECDTECGENCHCRLVPYNPKKSKSHFHKYE